MESKFRASPEFQKLQFHRVKNRRLADDYSEASLYPPELRWLHERYVAKEFGKATFRPGWWIFVDRKLVDRFGGSSNWDTKAFPRIREIVAQHYGKQA